MTTWTSAESLVAAEIASAVLAGAPISGIKIATITGLSNKEVANAIRNLLAADLVHPIR